MAAAAHQEADRQVLGALDEGRERLPGVVHRRRAGEHAAVEDHQPRHALGVLDRQAQADRPAPVVHDEGRVAQVEVLEQRRGHLHVAVVGVPAALHRLVRAPEADEVGEHDAVAGVAHGRQHVAPQEAPGGLAVPHHHRCAVALVDVGQAQPVDGAVVRCVGEVGQPLEDLVRRADRVGHPEGCTRSSKREQGLPLRRGRHVDRAGLAHPGDRVERLQAVEDELEGQRLAPRAVAAGEVEGPAGGVQRVVAGRLAVAAHEPALVGLVAHGRGDGQRRVAARHRPHLRPDVERGGQRLRPQALVQRRLLPQPARQLAHARVAAQPRHARVVGERHDLVVVPGLAAAARACVKRGVEPGGCSTSSADALAVCAACMRASSPASPRCRRMISRAEPSFQR